MQLGIFTPDARTGGYIGSIRSLKISLDNVRIVPRPKDPTAKDGTPDFDVQSANGSDLGAGWRQKRASDGLDYISLQLFDPSLNDGQVLRPALWPKKDGAGFVMVLNPPADAAPTTAGDPAPARPANANGAATSRKPFTGKEPAPTVKPA